MTVTAVTPLPPTGPGKPPTDIAQARQVKALALRLSGLTLEQVAQHAGYASRRSALRAIQRALADVQVADVDALRRLESARLDRLLSACWQGALNGDVAKIREARRITEARARLLGLNAPLQVEDVTDVNADIVELRVALAADLDTLGTFVVTDLDEG